MPSNPTFRTSPHLEGHVKVRLLYNTWEPNHIRSQALQMDFRIPPPYVEDVSVLVPLTEAYMRLSAYEDIFTRLKVAKILDTKDQLRSFEIQEEDFRTLAYHEIEGETLC